MNPKKRLGEMLMDAGIIDETQLKAALGHQRQWGVRLGQALVDLKLATEADIVRALSTKFGFPIAQLADLEPYALEQAVSLLPREFAVRNNVFPMAADPATLTVAMSDPSNLAIVDEIQFRTGRRVKVCMGGDREVADAVKRHYPAGDAEVEAIALDLDLDEGQSEAVFDPFGGGSKDALEAFFGQQPDPAAPPAGDPAPEPAPPAAPAAAAPAPRAAARARAPAPPPPTAPSPAAAQPRAAAAAPVKAPAPKAAVPRPAAPAPAAARASPQAPAASRAAPARPAPAGAPPAAAARSAAPTPRPAAPAPPPAASTASARARPATSTPRPKPPAPAPAAAPRSAELELEGPLAGEGADALAGAVAPFDVAPADLAPFPEGMDAGEPGLGADLAADEAAAGAQEPEQRPLTADEIAILDALERLAGGHHAEPDIVKPTQAMAALVRLLLRKRIITELEFLDEFGKK